MPPSPARRVPKRLAILLSAGGSTAAAVITACLYGELRGLYLPECVISNNPDAGGLVKARELGVSPDHIYVVERGQGFGDELLGRLRFHQADLVAQLGWLPKTPKQVVQAYQGRMINQHPGPLDPGYNDFGGQGMYGKRVHEARLDYCRRVNRPDDFFTEATVQLVHEEYDRGAVICTRIMDIEPNDTAETLQRRLLPLEHEAVIQALILLAERDPHPIVRRERLVRNDQEHQILTDAKRRACEVWPNG